MIFFMAPFVGKMAILGAILGVSITALGIFLILVKYYIQRKKK